MSPPSAKLLHLIPIAQAALAQGEALDVRASLELALALSEDLRLLFELDRELRGRGLIVHLLDLPQRLSLAGQPEQALAVARAFRFVAPDDLSGDIAVIHARAGQREQALAQLELSLPNASDRYVAEAKAGDTYRALGEDDAAEVYYRRSLSEAKSTADRSAAALRLTSFLLDTGREADASVFVTEQRALRASEVAAQNPLVVPVVGRNELCPCGSGKKYKKCHGA